MGWFLLKMIPSHSVYKNVELCSCVILGHIGIQEINYGDYCVALKDQLIFHSSIGSFPIKYCLMCFPFYLCLDYL